MTLEALRQEARYIGDAHGGKNAYDLDGEGLKMDRDGIPVYWGAPELFASYCERTEDSYYSESDEKKRPNLVARFKSGLRGRAWEKTHTNPQFKPETLISLSTQAKPNGSYVTFIHI